MMERWFCSGLVLVTERQKMGLEDVLLKSCHLAR